MNNAKYECETLNLKKGDIIVAFTDGVLEVEDSKGKQFGEDAMTKFIKKNHSVSAEKMTKLRFKKF